MAPARGGRLLEGRLPQDGGVRVVAQRVSWAAVSWPDPGGGEQRRTIGRGLLLLVGAGPADDAGDARRLADKVAGLRIFAGAGDRFDLGLEDVGGEALVVPQFTLYADARRGRRPSFVGAAPPDRARELVDAFADRLRERGVATRTGSFGARMSVSLENSGPVTIVLSTDPWESRIGG